MTDGADIKPAVIQNENHLYYQNTELQEYVKQYGTVIESWYPFGGRGHTSESFNNEVIVELAEKYNKTSAQIILRWQVQAGYIAIPGSSDPNHIAENYDIFDFELSEEDMQCVNNLNRMERYVSKTAKRTDSPQSIACSVGIYVFRGFIFRSLVSYL